ncbi:MAG: hypothetical protein GVY16_04115 [Planctomycetes bacterium]|nr:hypothetical protein [Phycisphaerae bacterium]NBB94907.1 hypothetical protein [Planctomycetota bacterium]
MIDLLRLGPAWTFLTCSEERLAGVDAARFDRAWLGLLAISLAWGAASVGLWHLSYHVCREPAGFYVAPAIVLGAAWLLGFYGRAAGALASFLGAGGESRRSLASSVLVVTFMLVLLVLGPDWHRQEPALPGWLPGWLRPASKIDRLLLLLPMWGAWTCMILPQFSRPDPAREPQLAAMACSGGPLTAAIVMGALLAISIGALAFLPWAQLAIPGVGIATALLGGLAMARAAGGMNRSVLLAANLLTQLAMLLTYLAVRDPRFW